MFSGVSFFRTFLWNFRFFGLFFNSQGICADRIDIQTVGYVVGSIIVGRIDITHALIAHKVAICKIFVGQNFIHEESEYGKCGLASLSQPSCTEMYAAVFATYPRAAN